MKKAIEHFLALRPQLLRIWLLVAASAIQVFAQAQGSGDISAPLVQFGTLGSAILTVLLVVAGFVFVGLLVWGGMTLASNRPRGIAMIAGGVVGALLDGLAFVLVAILTGNQVNTAGAGILLLPHGWL